MNKKTTVGGPVSARSIQPETIQARSSGWGEIEMLVRMRPPGAVAVPHGQSEHMLFLKSGRRDGDRRVRSVARFGGSTREWREVPLRSVTLVPAGHPFEWEWTYHAHSLHVIIPASTLERVAASLSDRVGPGFELLPRLSIHDPFVAALLEHLHCELTGAGSGMSLAVEAATSLLAVHLLNAYQGEAPRPVPQSHGLSAARQARVLELLNDRLCENVRLQELAEAAGLSEFHFAREFKIAFGIPPHEYLIRRRIEEAQALLRMPNDRSLAEIAAALGFADESHFRRHFKRIVGIPPGKYRRQAGR